jgi:hypothetical protein
VNVSAGGVAQCTGQLAADAFQFAICACDTVAPGGSQITTDSFDSTRGVYGGANVGARGHVGVNDGLDLGGANPRLLVEGNLRVGCSTPDQGGGPSCQLDIKSNSAVSGDVYVDGVLVGAGTVSGTTQTTLSSTSPPVATGVPSLDPCPCGADALVDIAAIVADAAVNNDNDNPAFTTIADPTLYANLAVEASPDPLRLPCGRYYLTAIRQASLSIVATGRTVVFVDGDVDVGSLSISVEGTGELDLFVKGNLRTQSATTLGSATNPAAVRTYVAGNVSFSASTTLGGNLYAPTADLAFGAAVDVYGSLFVRSVQFSGNSSIHFDEAVQDAGNACPPPPPPPPPPGGTTCGSCFDPVCGAQACLPDTGTCGACRSSLDCCVNETCNVATGVCELAQ